MEYTLKKSLGQHFLEDDTIIQQIIAALPVSTDIGNQVLEVGPGAGALTQYLVKQPSLNFKAVEIDREKVMYLLKKFPALKGRLIETDFLKMIPPFEGPFAIIGNFPYNISTQILFKILEWKDQVPEMVGMFQQDVALRIAAAPGNKVYGITSVLVQAFYEVEYLFDIPPEKFNPPPKVMSGLIRLKRKTSWPEMKDEQRFFLLVKMAFNQRRKMLRNAVKPLFDAAVLHDDIFHRRAETLSVEEFAQLTFRMQ